MVRGIAQAPTEAAGAETAAAAPRAAAREAVAAEVVTSLKGKWQDFSPRGWHTQCALTSTGKAAAPREPLKAVGVTTGAAESTPTSAISWTRPAESGAWRSTAGLGTTRSAPSRQDGHYVDSGCGLRFYFTATVW